eukprot:m.31035 g.31035  ORF g.31035 m.31035 type:complete len:359 (-) comp16386_c0_seq1:32-1108(-)
MADSGKIKSNKVKLLKRQQNVFHPSNPVVSITVWGIKHMMAELDFVKEQPLLLKDDFKAFSKVSVHNQCFNSSALPSKFTVKEYCPMVFRDLRCRFRVDSEEFVKSWISGNVSEMETFGKSTASQYVSEDKQFHMKILMREEVDLFLKMLAQYHTFIVERDGITYLPQFLALFRTSVSDKETYLVISRNLYSPGLPLNRIYSLKGSRVDRNASANEAEKDLPVFKDNDFIEKAEKIFMGTHAKEVFLDAIKCDLEYLSTQKLMGYILQVAYHKCDEVPPAVDPARDVYAVGKPGPHNEQVFIGFIDVLTKYSAKKVAGHTAKVMKHGTKKAAESTTVNPEQYASRLLKFVSDHVESQD